MEVELKYFFQDEESLRSFEDSFFHSKAMADELKEIHHIRYVESKEVSLEALYLDTLEMSLLNNKMSLRLRKENEELIVTFKSGEREGNLQERVELNFPLGVWNKSSWGTLFLGENINTTPVFKEDLLSELRDSRVYNNILNIVKDESFYGILKTKIQRKSAVFSFGNSKIEVDLDRGYIIGKLGEKFIQELELELIEGSKDDLISLGNIFTKHYNLGPKSGSKLQEGLDLMGYNL